MRALRSLLALLLAACSPSPSPSRAPSSSPSPSPGPAIELVESAPVETNLDHADIPNADVVWRAMFDGATRSIDLAEFYAVSAPGSRLEEVVRSLEGAAARGVRVRFLVEAIFLSKYPELCDRLRATKNVSVRVFDASKTMGGILHAKFFVVDGREAYLGSQNFDWRSLEHIQELGVRVREPKTVGALAAVFDSDFAFAGGEARPIAVRAADFPVTIELGGAKATLTPALSPKGFVGDDALWDLPAIVALLDSAKLRVEAQMLTYEPAFRDKKPFRVLDDALRRAAARGVAVRLLFSDWMKKPDQVAAIASLAAVPNVEVRLVSIPKWSGGDVPFARTVHAKYLVVDDAEAAWIGTSNWEGDYFEKSRNVGVVVRGGSLPARLHGVFGDGWGGPYAKPVAPAAP
jgi:phosphatidylserine/phosphatidylglycerophosphate/cardiolipin synthase-like enzyme